MIKNLNKKGFTLIELLAVIVVLAIIMLLAVQAVLPQMEKARKNAFVVEANAAIEAAQNLVLTKQVSNSNFTVNSGGSCVSIKTLSDFGYYEVNGKDQYKGYVRITRTEDSTSNNAGYSYSVFLTNSQYKIEGTNGKAKYGDVKVAGNTADIAIPTTGTGACAETITSDTN